MMVVGGLEIGIIGILLALVGVERAEIHNPA
jgi:hypothetical protein